MLHGNDVGAVQSMARTRRVRRAVDTLSLAFAAFLAGSRSVPLGDNGALLRELASHARAIRAARAVGACAAAVGSKGR